MIILNVGLTIKSFQFCFGWNEVPLDYNHGAWISPRCEAEHKPRPFHLREFSVWDYAQFEESSEIQDSPLWDDIIIHPINYSNSEQTAHRSEASREKNYRAFATRVIYCYGYQWLFIWS